MQQIDPVAGIARLRDLAVIRRNKLEASPSLIKGSDMSNLGTAPSPCLPDAAILCFCSYIDNPNSPNPNNSKQSLIAGLVQAFYPKWNVIWSAIETADGNYAFIAQTDDNKTYFVVRGSLPFEVDGNIVISWAILYNWFAEDFNVFGSTIWKYAPQGTAYVANGALDAFSQIYEATDAMGSGRSAYAVLKSSVQNKSSVYITGHSLGGNIANTYASYFAYQLKKDGLPNGGNYLFTFAAPAAGNIEFVNDLQGKFPGSQAYHYEINNDIIPKFPVSTSMILTVAALFSPSPLATQISVTYDHVTGYLSEAIEAMTVAILAASQTIYAQTTETSAQWALSGQYTANTFVDWFNEAAYQHQVLHYVFIFWGKGIEAKLSQFAPMMSKSRSAVMDLRAQT